MISAATALTAVWSTSFILKLFVLLSCSLSFSYCTYHTHRVVSSEYYRSCNANMFVTLFMKNSRYCELMRWIILLLETKFIEVARIAMSYIFA